MYKIGTIYSLLKITLLIIFPTCINVYNLISKIPENIYL